MKIVKIGGVVVSVSVNSGDANPKKKLDNWQKLYGSKLIVYNFIIVFLFLLRSAGYFNPYFPITVNFIILFAIIMSIFLLGARSGTLFMVTIVFWAFAGLLNVLQIGVWAERTGIYAYESLVLAVLMFVIENIRLNYKSKS